MAGKALDVVVVGGSTAGLMHGIMLKRLGHNVHILEQHTSSAREGEAAGMSAGMQTQAFLTKHDRIVDRPYTVPAAGLHIVNRAFALQSKQPIPFKMVSWKTLYYRLRANFDGYVSEYVPEPPKATEEEGSSYYDVGKRVVDVKCVDGFSVTIVYEDLIDGGEGTIRPDFVIAADGANSTIRKLVAPRIEQQYAGYLTWRGVISEKMVSEETKKAFEGHATLHFTGKGSYVIVYTIPGDNGTLTSGDRHLNFVWYYNCPRHSPEYTAAMTDVDGIFHHSTVPFGKIAPAVWSRQQNIASSLLAPPVAELVHKVEMPFVTAIRDYISPQPTFLDGKVVLIGDALSLFRPHVAQSTNQAAMHCLGLEKVLKGEKGLKEWEKEAMWYARSTMLRSRTVGHWFLSNRLVWLWHEARFKILVWAHGWGFV